MQHRGLVCKWKCLSNAVNKTVGSSIMTHSVHLINVHQFYKVHFAVNSSPLVMAWNTCIFLQGELSSSLGSCTSSALNCPSSVGEKSNWDIEGAWGKQRGRLVTRSLDKLCERFLVLFICALFYNQCLCSVQFFLWLLEKDTKTLGWVNWCSEIKNANYLLIWNLAYRGIFSWL